MKNIILGITGSIAATKTPQIIAELQRQGHNIKCIITKNGEQFVDLQNFPVPKQDLILHTDKEQKFLDAKNVSIDHIDLARWADIILIAPASANILAKLAAGIADDQLSSICLATTAKIIVVPAMNKVMWSKKTTQANVRKIESLGIKILGPAHGEQACGDVGYGRMLEPNEIKVALYAYFNIEKLLLGKQVLLTAGPTQEPIDPVRYISNRSSGKMGFALAEALIEAGAEVTLVTGPVSLASPGKCKVVKVKTAQEMYDEVMRHIKKSDVFIGCAAVSDYRVETTSNTKIKKTADTLTLTLVKNPDILKEVAKKYPKKLMVGFAAETDNATRKLQEKDLDIIIANEVGTDKGFDQEDNTIIIMDQRGNKLPITGMKNMLARKIVFYISMLLS